MSIGIHCLADVCIIPIGTGSSSVSDEIAIITSIAEKSGLHTTLHSAGTTIAGPWLDVMTLIGKMHQTLHDRGVARIQSDIRVGTRTDKVQMPEDKVRVIREKLKRLE